MAQGCCLLQKGVSCSCYVAATGLERLNRIKNPVSSTISISLTQNAFRATEAASLLPLQPDPDRGCGPRINLPQSGFGFDIRIGEQDYSCEDKSDGKSGRKHTGEAKSQYPSPE